jgi:hypothetical protein
MRIVSCIIRAILHKSMQAYSACTSASAIYAEPQAGIDKDKAGQTEALEAANMRILKEESRAGAELQHESHKWSTPSIWWTMTSLLWYIVQS